MEDRDLMSSVADKQRHGVAYKAVVLVAFENANEVAISAAGTSRT